MGTGYRTALDKRIKYDMKTCLSFCIYRFSISFSSLVRESMGGTSIPIHLKQILCKELKL
jgi:hypothetical protein